MESNGEGNPGSSTVLEEIFYVTSKRNTYYKVRLTEKGLSLHKEHNGTTKSETIALGDIIGCRCMRSKRRNAGSCACRPGASKSQVKLVESSAESYQAYYDELDTSAYLYIYAYALKKTRVKGGLRRERTTITLRFRSFDKYEDNLREASRWRLAIKCLVANAPVPKNLMSPSHGNLDALMGACPGENRKLLVLLNPKSGSGRGRETFQRRIHPILSEAERPYEIHITKHANYAREFIRTRDIYQWSGLLMVGGDGIVFEVVNGLFQRSDWEKALRELPLGVIPCGSGNGLAKSIAHAKQYGGGEPKSFHTAFSESINDLNDCVDNEIITESLTLETETEKRHRLDSFYSATSAKSTYFSTGSVSSYHSVDDNDSAEIGAENICNSQIMYGPSSTLPALTTQLSNCWTQIQGEFVMVHAAYQSHLGQDYFFAPRARLADGIIWLLIVKAGITRANLLHFLLGLSSGTHVMCAGVDMIPVKAFRIEPMEGTSGHITVDGEEVDYGPLQAEIFPSLATVMVP
ncbi:sphingosine kinase 2 isoform X2 [Harpegnathos saltator]|uniref:sphingosine kinase 2 isoform X2 n=1 Tax=Harpegnathos saltator TaxID=610380 RepID=UPI000DBEE1F8|nr:sphingosine kinase 2 isoform X2 [Harpegnathos saltator]